MQRGRGWGAALVLTAALGIRGEAFQAITTNLSAHWSMDAIASGSTSDSTANNNTMTQATAANQPVATASGMFGGALTFDGTNDYLSAVSSASLNVGTASFTAAAWVRPAGTTPARVFNKWNGTIGWILDVHIASGAVASPGMVRFKMSDGTTTIDHHANASLVNGTWTHLAATVNQTTKLLKLYVNGNEVLSQSTSAMTGTLTNAAAAGIGSIPSALGNYYNGALDEVRLYAAALTPTEIRTLIAPLPPATLDAVAGNGTAALTWSASTPSQSYNLYRSVTSGVFTGPAYLTGLTGTSTTDPAATNGVTWHYVIRAVNQGVESANSPQASASPVAPPPRTKVAGNESDSCGCGVVGRPGAGALLAMLAALAILRLRPRG